MNYLNKICPYEVVDVIENTINEMDLFNTDYADEEFTFIHGLPVDTRNEHNQRNNSLPVVLLFEPLNFTTNMDEAETIYKSGEVKLFFMDKGTRYGKAKQTTVNYQNVIDKLGDVVNVFILTLENQKEVTKIDSYQEKNWPDFAVNVEQRSGNNSKSIMYQNLTGKEISFDIVTHKIFNC